MNNLKKVYHNSKKKYTSPILLWTYRNEKGDK